MSIDYTLYLAKHADPKVPAEILRTEFQLAGGKDSTDEDSVRSWLDDGPVSITIWRLDRRIPGVADENAVDAKMGIIFDLRPSDLAAAKKIMIRDLCTLLTELDGDAVFFNLDDQVILRRKDGRLEVNTDADFWTSELRALVSPPHEARPLKRLREPSP